MSSPAVARPPIQPPPRANAATTDIPCFRAATKADVAALTELEERCFETDRLSRRSFQRMVGNTDTAHLLLAEDRSQRLLGYSLILFHRGTSLARLYSIAVEPQARGRGVA